MPVRSGGVRSGQVPMPIAIAVVAGLLIVIGVAVWRAMLPPPAPLAGKTQEQQAEAYKRAREEMQKNGQTSSFLNR